MFNWYKGMIFLSWKQSSYSLFTHELWRLFTLFRMSTFFRPPFSYLLQRVLCFILGLELFHKKEVWIVSKALITWVGTGAIRDWKIIFEIAKLLKTTIHPSRVKFRNPQSFNTLCKLETILRWKSKTRVTSCELWVPIYELLIQVYELQVQIH